MNTWRLLHDCGTAEELYEGYDLADVQGVSSACRSGSVKLLGFPQASIPESMGLQDAILGARWVQNNVATFGDDLVSSISEMSPRNEAGLLSLIPAVEGGSYLWHIQRRGLTYIPASSKLPYSVNAGFKNEVGVYRPRWERVVPSVSAGFGREKIVGQDVIEFPLHQALTSLHNACTVSIGEIIAKASLHASEKGH